MALNNTSDSTADNVLLTEGIDTTTVDTGVRDTSYVLVLERAPVPELPARITTDEGASSWLLLGLLALFVIAAVRYRKNSKYISAIFREVTSIRERGNILDNTVREVSYMLILNFVWVLSAGIVLYSTISPGGDDTVAAGWCILCALGYAFGMTVAYTIAGNVFSDSKHTRMWVRGFWAAQSLGVAVLFPISIMLICYPGNAYWAVAVGWIGYGLTKILFIWKGFRIFFSQISSWVLFLYYLCSLEVVPVILTLSAACVLTGTHHIFTGT